MSGVYIHIPFCKQACTYCNFHFSTSLKYKDSLISAINKEIKYQQSFFQKNELTSIYFGGGSPSLLNEHDLDLIFEALAASFVWDKDIEITLEANPDDITKKMCDLWKKCGINRLSIGIQSFLEKDLKWMNRAHSADQASFCIPLVQDKGFQNLTCDLIYGIPDSDMAQWEKNIQKLLNFDIPHISSYALTVEEKTLLHHQVQNNKIKPADEKLVEQQFLFLVQKLENEGFDHYEISNFGRPGHYAVHNTSYWKGFPYLGIGPSAHSYQAGTRYWNVANNALYIKDIESGILPQESEVLSPADQYNEYVMTSLRTMWGVETKTLMGNHLAFAEWFLKQIKIPLERGLVENKKDTYILTNQGKLFADGVASDLFYIPD